MSSKKPRPGEARQKTEWEQIGQIFCWDEKKLGQKVKQSLADLKSKTSPEVTTRFKRNPGLINSHGVSIGVLYWLYQIHLLSNIWADFPTLGYASDFGSYKLIPNQIGTLTIDSRPSFSKKNMDPNWMHFLHVESRRRFVPVGKESHFSRQSLPLEDLDKTLQCWFNQLFLVHDRFLPFFLTPKWTRRLFNLWDVFKPALSRKTCYSFRFRLLAEQRADVQHLESPTATGVADFRVQNHPKNARWEMIAPCFLVPFVDGSFLNKQAVPTTRMPLGNFVNCVDFSTTNGPGVTKEMWSVISSNKPWITLLVAPNFLRFLMVQEFLHRPSWHLNCTSKNRNTFGHQKPLLQMEAYKFGSSNFVISYQTRLPARFCWHQHKKSSNITELPSIQLAKGRCNGATFRSCWFSNRCQGHGFLYKKNACSFSDVWKKSRISTKKCVKCFAELVVALNQPHLNSFHQKPPLSGQKLQ